MATRRMKIKAVANIGPRGRTRPNEPLLPPESITGPLSPRKRCPSPFSMQPQSPQSPGFRNVNLDDQRAVKSKSPIRRPSPAKSPRPLPSRSPGPAQQRPPSSKSPKLQNPKSPLNPLSPGDPCARSCTPPKSPKRPPRPSSGSSFIQPRPISPAPRIVSVDHSSRNHTLDHFDPRSPPSPGYSGTLAARQTSSPHLDPFPTHVPIRGNYYCGKDMSQTVSKESVSCDILRQRLQKPPSALTTSKYQTARKEFFNKYPNPNIVTNPNELTILQYAFWNPPKPKTARSRAPSVEAVTCKKEPINTVIKKEPNSNIPNRRATISYPPSFDNREELEQASTAIAKDVKKSSDNEDENDEHLGPRVKVGPDGSLVIDEESLMVETSESKRAKKQLAEMETVSGFPGTGLYRFKKQAKRGGDWSIKETVRFYRALSLCGTDFSMMSSLFPNRTRVELKAKFKREDRRNPAQVSKALSCQVFNPDEGFSSSDEETNKEDEVLTTSEADETVLIAGEDIKKEGQKRRRKNVPKVPTEPKEKLKRGRPPKLWNASEDIPGKTKKQSEALKRKLLKFDESDPLGFKVVSSAKTKPQHGRDVLTLSTQVQANSNPVVAKKSKVDDLPRSDNFSLKYVQVNEISPSSSKPVQIQSNIKPLPYRVPGPGGTPKGNQANQPSVEELEIEISCQ